jgi:hypothetical protein
MTAPHKAFVLALIYGATLAASCSDISVGGRAGATIPLAGTLAQGSVVNTSGTTSPIAGLTVEGSITESMRWRLEPGLRFHGAVLDVAELDITEDRIRTFTNRIDLNASLVELPVLLLWTPSRRSSDAGNVRSGKTLEPYVGVGAMLALGRGISWSDAWRTTERTAEGESIFEGTTSHHQSNFGSGLEVVLASGMRYRATEVFEVSLDIRLAQRLSSIRIESLGIPRGISELNLPTTSLLIGAGVVVRL